MPKDFKLEMNDAAKILFSGMWINGKTLGYIGGEVLKSTIGPSSTSIKHFNKGQGAWPKLNPQYKKSKSDKRIFVQSGKALKALKSSASGGKIMEWGSPKDIAAKGYGKKRYVSNGIWSMAETKKDRLLLITGFSGKLKNSRAYKKKRQQLAIRKDGSIAKLKGARKRKAINAAVSTKEVEALARKAGIKKFAMMGASGFTKSGKAKKARGKDNLAYANVVQTGKFKGIQSGGKLFDPAALRRAHMSKQKITGTSSYGGKQRPVLPYDNTDVGIVVRALERSYADVLREFNR